MNTMTSHNHRVVFCRSIFLGVTKQRCYSLGRGVGGSVVGLDSVAHTLAFVVAYVYEVA